MILLLDNYDSFVHNLARYFQRLGQETVVIRSDAIDPAGVRACRPAAVVLSPGPCTPAEAGCSVEVVRTLGNEFPMLGVCLGHQALAVAFDGNIVRAPTPVHGRTSSIVHAGTDLFSGVPNPVSVCRYHSLVVDRDSLPPELQVTAESSTGIVMAIRHRMLPLFGVQFHPESILTEYGFQMLANFLSAASLPLPDDFPTLESERPRPAPIWSDPPPQPVTF